MRATQYTGVPAVHNPYHGPVVSARTLEKAVYAMEGLEETARLAITLTGRRAATLDTAQIAGLIKTFNID